MHIFWGVHHSQQITFIEKHFDSRVTEINWTKWRSDISFKMEVKPEKEETETKNEEPGKTTD